MCIFYVRSYHFSLQKLIFKDFKRKITSSYKNIKFKYNNTPILFDNVNNEC